jgi:hypothetical protein
MDRSFILLNGWVTTCNMLVHHRLSCADCDCQGPTTSATCTKYTVELEYDDVCQQLGFDRKLPLFVVGTPNLNVPVELPDKTGLQTKDWVDKMGPVVRIPVHANQPDTVVLTQSATGKDIRPKTTSEVHAYHIITHICTRHTEKTTHIYTCTHRSTTPPVFRWTSQASLPPT